MTTTNGLPPGPREPALLQSLRYAVSPYGAIERSRRYGDRFTARVVGQPPLVVFADPEAIKDIFTCESDDLRGGQSNVELLGPILGAGSMLLLDGPGHLRERRLMLPPFHGERMQAYGRLMQEITDRVIDGWPVGRPFRFRDQMQTITLEVILRAVFGVDEGPALGHLRDHILRLLGLFDSVAGASFFIPAFRLALGGWSPWGRFVHGRRAFGALIRAEIARRRAEGTAGRADVLSLLLEARDEDGAPMTEDALVDEMFTILGAGHETTASGLAWTLYHVLGRPDVVERLRAELRAVAEDGPIAPAQVGRLEYLDAVLKESARLTPVATNVNRRLAAPMRIGGIDLPAGVSVSASIYLVHHRADLWRDPERFDPDRFLSARPTPYTFFPFGGGLRRCLGAAFATYEMKVVLAQILARTELRIAPGYRMRPVLRAITVSPSRGMPVVLDERRAAIPAQAGSGAEFGSGSTPSEFTTNAIR
jgi:cytochrome P450